MSDNLLKNHIIPVAVLTLLSFYLFFFHSGNLALTDPDETFYAQTAKEMLAKGEWATPYLYGKPQFEKPILFYWLLESSYKIFGINEFASRFPSGLLALLGVIGIYFLGSILFNKRAGLISALILATNVEYVILSRACVTDMALFVFLLLGFLFFFLGYMKKKGNFYIFASVFFALATLTKGPIYIILAGAALIIYLFIIKDLGAIKWRFFLAAAAVFLAIALPWYILMYKLHGKDFIDVFFGFHNITRFLESEHEIGSGPFYNIPILFGGFAPWSAFLPIALWRMFKKAMAKERAAIFVLTWFFVIFAFFSLSSTKLATYIFPSFLSSALVVAVSWDEFLKAGALKSIKGMKVSYYLLIFLMLFGTIGGIVYAKIDYPVISYGLSVSFLFLLFGFLLSFIAALNKKFMAAFLFIVYALLLFLYPLALLVLPAIEPYETSKEISLKLLSLMKPHERLGSESNYLAGLAFYAEKTPIDFDKHNTLIKFLASEERVWCVLKEKNHIQLYDPDINRDYRYMQPSYMVYCIGKRCIVTNKAPYDGKYIVKRERENDRK